MAGGAAVVKWWVGEVGYVGKERKMGRAVRRKGESEGKREESDLKRVT
jgi:hypothetical protein